MTFTVQELKEMMLEKIDQLTEAKTVANPVEAHELHLYASNDGQLYHQMGKHITAALQKKHDKGQYVHHSDEHTHHAVQAWGNLMDVASKKYAKEFGYGHGHAFNAATRRLAAQHMADEKRDEHGWTEKKAD